MPLDDQPGSALRIAYDARLSLGQYRGMGRFLRTLIEGREHTLLGLCATGEEDRSLTLTAAGFRFYPLWEQVSIPRLVRSHQAHVLIAPYNTAPLLLPPNVRLVLIVHDLIFMQPLPWSHSLYQNVGRWYRKAVAPPAVRRADIIVTVSNYTASQLASRLAVGPDRLRVISNSIRTEWFCAGQFHDAIPPYVLVVAGEAPSKNLSRAIAAFARCRELIANRPLRLKIAGVKEDFRGIFLKEARLKGVGDTVDFVGYISDSEMRRLYQQAKLFVMPSLSEGFGIPMLEAMASGTPVAASSATCLPEIGGDAALYFDPLSVEDMARTMYTILNDSALQAKLSATGPIQARRFHVDVVRKQICRFWEELEAMANPTPAR